MAPLQTASPNPDPRAAAARNRTRTVRMGFVFGVVLGAIFIAAVLAPWAASHAMRGERGANPAAAVSSEQPSN
jgi:hypothetical protein